MIINTNLCVSAATDCTVDEAMNWLDGLINTKVGTGQCVALIKSYYSHLGASPVAGNACDYATNSLPNGWKRVKGGVPQRGDILVYTGAKYGHVAIYAGGTVSYHQNMSGQYVEKKTSWPYNNSWYSNAEGGTKSYWGYIRPNFLSSNNITYAKGDDQSHVTIKWAKVTNATKYTLQRRKAGDSSYSDVKTGITSTNYTDSGLATGQRYYYKVVAYNGSTKLSTSDSVGVYTKFNPPTVTTVSNSKLKISWNSVSKAESYTIMRRKDGEEYDDIKTVTATEYTDSGLSPNTKYYYWIQANCVVDEDEMVAKSTTGQAYTLTDAPSINSKSDVTNTSLTLSWNSVSGANRYRIQYRQAGDQWDTGSAWVETTNTTCNISNLEAGKLYWFRVYAVGNGGNSAPSDSKGIYLNPNAPTASTAGVNSINVNWAYAGGETKYELLTRKSGDSEYVTLANEIDGTSYTHNGLIPGTQYYYKIKAYNKEHSSIVSGRSDAGYGYTKLLAPTVTAKDAYSISLSWDRGVMDGDYTYTYRICRRPSGTSNFAEIAIVSEKSYQDTGLQPNTSYDYYIDVLRNDGAWCTNSEGITATTTAPPVIVPSGITISDNNISIAEGETYKLNAAVFPDNANDKSILWNSDDSNIASVSEDGTITAIKAGSTNIYANTCNGLTAVCSVTVDTLENLCDHSFGEWTEAKAATCIANGERTRTCSKCGKTESEIIPALGHSYSEDWTTIKEPTCSEYGIRKHLCTECGETDEATAETIEMIPHSIGDEWVINKEPTCTEEGVKYQLCSVCNAHTNVTTIPTIPHEYDDNYIVVQVANCQQIGIEYCMCTNCGEKSYTYSDKTEHEYEVTDMQEATTSEEGHITYTCVYCGDETTEVIPVISNSARLYVTDVNARAGSTVDVMVELENNPGIAGMVLNLAYDDKLKLVKATKGEALADMAFTEPGDYSANPVNLVWDAMEADSSNGHILTLTFEIPEDAEEREYEVNLSYKPGAICDNDMNNVDFAITNGVITVKNFTPGDVNGDDKIDVKDIIILRRFIAGGYDISYVEAAVDINKDGSNDVKDIITLRRYIAGGYGIELN